MSRCAPTPPASYQIFPRHQPSLSEVDCSVDHWCCMRQRPQQQQYLQMNSALAHLMPEQSVTVLRWPGVSSIIQRRKLSYWKRKVHL